jgi:hypothetical protein
MEITSWIFHPLADNWKKIIKLLPCQVIWFSLFPAGDTMWGTAPLEAAMKAVEQHWIASAFVPSMVTVSSRGATASPLISMPRKHAVRLMGCLLLSYVIFVLLGTVPAAAFESMSDDFSGDTGKWQYVGDAKRTNGYVELAPARSGAVLASLPRAKISLSPSVTSTLNRMRASSGTKFPTKSSPFRTTPSR